MRFSILTVLATLGSMAVAQNVLGSLPKCGQDCFGNNFAGCAQFDYACICGNEGLIAQLSCCVSTNCDDNDKNTIITLANGLCKAYGVNVPTQASCAASASPTATSTASSGSSSASSSPSITSSVSSSASSGPSSTSSGPSRASSSGGSATTSAPATASASQSQTAAAQSSTGTPGAAAPVATANAGLGLAIGMVGLLVAL